MSYTVKQLSDLAGVSIRTLHYYDELGLLKPETVGANGYRYYGEISLLRLQQILFYRELGLELTAIKAIVTDLGFDLQAALESHRQSLQGRVERLNRLITTVDDTILHLKGKKQMSQKQLFTAFTDEEQAKYEKQAEQMYDPATVKASQKKWKSYNAEDKQRIADEGNQVYQDLLAAMPQGADSTAVQSAVERWRKHMDYFWTPNLDQLVGLANLYNDSPDFRANFDKIDPRLAPFMREAVQIYVKNHKH
jgi:MerR family transcriptional regulator, thiopeptide resistance regulator